MRIDKILSVGLLSCFTLFGLSSCDTDTAAEERAEERAEDSALNETDSPAADDGTLEADLNDYDETDIYYASEFDPQDIPTSEQYYTYGYLTSDGTVERIPTKDMRVTAEARQVTSRDATYSKEELDGMPYFKANCKTAARPEKCNNDAVEDYVKANLNYPASAERTGKESVENVVFVINEDGSIADDNIRVISRGEDDCNACAAAAVRAVRSMPDWQPAMRNGKPVKVRMVLPVRFDMLGQ